MGFLSEFEVGTKDEIVPFPEDDQYLRLPSCMKCMNLLDATASGLLTILCTHTFHCDCGNRWDRSNNCGVCQVIKDGASGLNCKLCGDNDGLWSCMICNHLGCSRYKNKHSQVHYNDSGHSLAVEIGTERIWCYLTDNFVHRYTIFYE